LGERHTMTAHTPEHVNSLLLEMSERDTAAQLGISRRQVRNIAGRSTDLPHKPATIEGVTAEHSANASNIWQFAIDAQAIVYEKHSRKQKQAITLPDEPVAIAFLSDLHIGSAGTDYQAIKADAELIRDTPGMYAGFHGDGTDNWIVGKLTALQRGQAIGFDAERLLFESWIDLIAPKLLWWVEGNHDDWTEKLCGSSPNRSHLASVRAIYDRNQAIIRLNHAGRQRVLVVRHRWRFSSIFNPTHGLEVGWDRGDIDYDWAVGGHTHIGTYARPFHRHGKKRLAILTGTYKLLDSFGEEIGFPAPKGRGCGAMVLDTDGSEIWFDELHTAAKYLGYLRGE
jgi:hypothetical protein